MRRPRSTDESRSVDESISVQLPDSAPMVGPERRRRRQRSVDRIRIGLWLGGAMIAGTALFALPLAEDVRTSTLDFLSIGSDEPDDSLEVATPEENEITVVESTIEFDRSVFVDPRMVGVSPPNEIEGILTFRGSPTRSFYGRGPVPDTPEVVWRYPETGGLCRSSTVGSVTRGWCGTGWTGQPSIFRRDGRLWTVFGALDGAVHFLDAETGERLLEPFQTDDIIKGSVTIDPDGYPIVYTGSRDNFYRVIGFDRGEPVELWKLDAEEAGGERKWNNDWDGAGLVIDDYLFIGGENSRIHIVKLNRGYDDDGFAVVAPELVFSAPGWDDELISAVGDNVSIENSVAISGDTLYFANSGGLVQGWDIAPLRSGDDPERIFRYWVGDDVDASIVIDEEGMLYVAAEYERGTARSRELGQLIKLDPSEGDDALVWAVEENQGLDTGIWGTPALHDSAIIFGSQGGNLRAVDRDTGESLWTIELGFHLWQSPVVIDDVLLMGDCRGTLRAYDVTDVRTEPDELWALSLDDGCIESTPAIWEGTIVVGTRLGGVYGIR